MKKGYWDCAEKMAEFAALSGSDVLNDVALESRSITARISGLKSALESARPPSQTISPVCYRFSLMKLNSV